MNEVQIFNFEGNQVRTIEIEGEPWLVGKDVASVLGYSNPSKAVINHVDDEDKQILSSQNGNLENIPNRGLLIVNESGLYSLIISSKLPSAKKFKHWVTSEVLPAIRKHGAYLTDQKAFDIVHNKSSLIDLLQQAANQLREKDIQIEEMKPKAIIADAITSSETSVSIGSLAKILKKNGIEVGRNRLFAFLRDKNYLIEFGDDYNLPTQYSMELGLTEVNEKPFINKEGVQDISRSAKITGKGQQYFINKFLKEN